MIRVSHEVTIRREAAAVSEVVVDVERYPEWQRAAGIRSVVRTDDGALAVGSRFTMQRAARGSIATIEAIVTALEPAQRFAFRTTDADGFVGDFETALAPTVDGTRVSWSARMHAPGLYRLLQPLIARELRRSARADLEELRRRVEAA